MGARRPPPDPDVSGIIGFSTRRYKAIPPNDAAIAPKITKRTNPPGGSANPRLIHHRHTKDRQSLCDRYVEYEASPIRCSRRDCLSCPCFSAERAPATMNAEGTPHSSSRKKDPS